MSDNILKDYLMSIGNYDPLTPAEEIELSQRYKATGDKYAREKLINHNLKLVVYVAKNYKCNNLTLLDLIEEGNIGLMKAVDKFDPEMGNRFSTCAVQWIRQSILKAINDKSKTIRLPAHIYALVTKYKTAEQELMALGNMTPTEEEIAAKMEVPLDKIKSLKGRMLDAVSLDTPLGDDSDDTLSDLQSDPYDESPVEYHEKNELSSHIQELIGTYKPRTQKIMRLRFGISDPQDPTNELYNEEHTLEEIGEIIGITRERVRQICNETLADMRSKMNKELDYH